MTSNASVANAAAAPTMPATTLSPQTINPLDAHATLLTAAPIVPVTILPPITAAEREASRAAAQDKESEDDGETDPDYDPECGMDYLDWLEEMEHEDSFTLYDIGEDGKAKWRDSESSYTEERLARSGSIYDDCTALELRGFVRARGLLDPCPGGRTFKYVYIRALEKGDKVPSFRLMDLVPELRNMVYVELLTMPPGKKTCHPQILRSCRQVHKEATELLYAENTIECVLSANEQQPHSFLSHGEEVSDCHLIDGSNRMKFPGYLRRLHHLRITLRGPILVTLPASHAVAKTLRLQLAKLTAYVMDRNKLKSLTVDFCTGIADEVEEKAGILFPLRRLRNIHGVSIVGDVSKDTIDTIVKDVRSSRPAVNILRHYQLLKAEANAFQSLRRVLDVENDRIDCECECEFCLSESRYRTAARIDDTLMVASSIINHQPDSNGTVENEKLALERLEDLSAALAHVNKNMLHICLRKYVDAVNSRTAYDTKHRLVPSFDLGGSAADFA